MLNLLDDIEQVRSKSLIGTRDLPTGRTSRPFWLRSLPITSILAAAQCAGGPLPIPNKKKSGTRRSGAFFPSMGCEIHCDSRLTESLEGGGPTRSCAALAVSVRYKSSPSQEALDPSPQSVR